MSTRLDLLFVQVARAAASAIALALVFPGLGAGWAVLPAVTLFLAAFTLAHDLAHGALRLPARVNEVALALTGGLMLTSGHGMRVGHLRHHARPLAADDIEGAAVHGSFWRAVVNAPRWALAVRVHAWRRASRRDRRWQRVEYGASVALAAALVVAGGAGRVYALVALALQLAAPVWAGRMPHTAPGWMIEAARRLSWTRSPVALSLAFHDLHHRRPSLPTLALARAAALPTPALPLTAALPTLALARAAALGLLLALGVGTSSGCATVPDAAPAAPRAALAAAAARRARPAALATPGTRPTEPADDDVRSEVVSFTLAPGAEVFVHVVLAPGGQVRFQSASDAPAALELLAHPLADLVREHDQLAVKCTGTGEDHLRTVHVLQGDALDFGLVSRGDYGFYTLRVANPGDAAITVHLRMWLDRKAALVTAA